MTNVNKKSPSATVEDSLRLCNAVAASFQVIMLSGLLKEHLTKYPNASGTAQQRVDARTMAGQLSKAMNLFGAHVPVVASNLRLHSVEIHQSLRANTNAHLRSLASHSTADELTDHTTRFLNETVNQMTWLQQAFVSNNLVTLPADGSGGSVDIPTPNPINSGAGGTGVPPTGPNPGTGGPGGVDGPPADQLPIITPEAQTAWNEIVGPTIEAVFADAYASIQAGGQFSGSGLDQTIAGIVAGAAATMGGPAGAVLAALAWIMIPRMLEAFRELLGPEDHE